MNDTKACADPADQADPADITTMRKIYFNAWQKHLCGTVLMPMEVMMVDLIQQHPEYHALFATSENYQYYEHEKFALDHNPFFHLGLHCAVKEQVMTDRPAGIQALYHQVRTHLGCELAAEERLVSCLAWLLTEQFNATDLQANDIAYLDAVRKVLN